MEKEFVPYKIALALKELGFDESCFGFYDEFSNNKVCYGYSDGINKAPTFSQAFRFFREKYNLNGIIAPRFYNDGSLWYVTEEIDISKNDINTLNSHLFQGIFEMHKTYEEAELECLKKLIEI